MYEALKRARKESREEEIRLYGKPINHNKVFKSKKVYSRKNSRVDFWSIILYFNYWVIIKALLSEISFLVSPKVYLNLML